MLHGCALGERSSGGIWKFRTSSFKCYVDHSHTMYNSGNIDVRNWVHLFESRCVSLTSSHFNHTLRFKIVAPHNCVIPCTSSTCFYLFQAACLLVTLHSRLNFYDGTSTDLYRTPPPPQHGVTLLVASPQTRNQHICSKNPRHPCHLFPSQHVDEEPGQGKWSGQGIRQICAMKNSYKNVIQC